MNKNEIDVKTLDLMKNERFIEWKMFPNEQINAYWEKYLEDNPQERFIFEQADKYFPDVKLSSNRVSVDKKHLVIDKINHSINKKRSKTVFRSIAFAVAATFIGIIVLVMLPKRNNEFENQIIIVGSEIGEKDIQLISNNKTTTFQNNIDIEVDMLGELKIKSGEEENSVIAEKSSINILSVPFGKRSTIHLADGSKVWLNSGTILEFPTNFASKSREILLKKGEIYIEVAENPAKPFFVKTSDFDVKVYGTKFNVNAYEDRNTSVVLAEGKIGLFREDADEFIVKPNERAVFSAGKGFVTQSVNVDHYVGWRFGYMEFDRTPMTEVLQQVGRYYNISFDYDQVVELHKRTCTGRIFLSENLDFVMGAIGVLTNSKYTRNNNQIILINNK